VTVNAYHGLVRGTDAKCPPRRASCRFNAAQRPEEAAGEIAEFATSPSLRQVSGRLIHDGKPIRSPFEDDVEAQERLFEACEDLTGVHFTN
jgi:hypothetical protein